MSASGPPSTEVVRIHRVHRTVLEMLSDRGYLVPKETLEISLSVFRAKYAPDNAVKKGADGLQPFFPKRGGDSEQIIVFFADKAKTGMKDVETYIKQMQHMGIPRGILIIRDSITPSAKQGLTVDSSYTLELFNQAELLVNITKHRLVPKHTLLSPSQKLQLLATYKLQESQLPRMLISDPVARYYGLGRGDVVRIQRPSETAGTYITYRIVV